MGPRKKALLVALLITTILLTGLSAGELSTASEGGEEENETYDLPIIGEVTADAYPLILLTALIAFVDGLNPCSIWILSFLLGMVIYSGKKKVFLVGATFLMVTALVYGLFIAGVLTIFHFITHLFWIRLMVASIAIFFAVVSIKDFFWFGKGLSFTIPERYKPGIYKKIRGLMREEGTAATVTATAALAAGVALIELPCTAGFPMIWSQIVAERGVGTGVFLFFLLLYVLVYLSIELVIYLSAAWRMKKIDFGLEKGRMLKFVGGSIMLVLGLTMLIDYSKMYDFRWSFFILSVSIAGSFLIAKIFITFEIFQKNEED